jgi:Flp pilus assembly secretin CpaC
MKKLTIGMLAALCAWTAWGLSVPVGERRTLELGFEPESFIVSQDGRDSVRVVLPPEGSGSDRVTVEGKAVGQCDVTFYVDGVPRRTESVRVTSGLSELRRSLSARLEEITGVTVDEDREKLVLTGVISNPADWKRMEKVLGMEAYRDKVENLVVFRVDQRTIDNLKRQIAGMGFKLTTGYPQDIGTLQMLYEDNVLKLTGTVWSQADADKLKRLLEMQSWLRMSGTAAADAGSKAPGAVCVLNIGVDQEFVELTAVIMGISESASRRIGAGTPTIQPFYKIFYDFLTGKHGTETMNINASINNVMEAFAGNGMMRDSEKASMRFHVNTDEPSRIKWGGTMKLKLQFRDQDGNLTQSFEDIEYGFTLEKLAARRISEDKVELQLKVEQRTQPKLGDDGSWDMSENVYNPVVECTLGETVLIGGYEKMREVSDLPSGMPLLRHVPIVNWFVSSEGHVDQDINMVMAISVNPVKPGSAAAAVLPPKDITLEIDKTNDQRLKEKQRWKGCLYPLNWLGW